MLYGGTSRSHESIGREVALLNTDSLTWERPESAQCAEPLSHHSTTVIARTRLLAFGGSKGTEAMCDASVFGMDTLKWVQLKGLTPPPARLAHAAASVREKVCGSISQCVFVVVGNQCMRLQNNLQTNLALSIEHADMVLQCREAAELHLQQQHCRTMTQTSQTNSPSFIACRSLQLHIFGGQTADGTLLNDLWVLDQETMQWSESTCFGYAPSPRKGEPAC